MGSEGFIFKSTYKFSGCIFVALEMWSSMSLTGSKHDLGAYQDNQNGKKVLLWRKSTPDVLDIPETSQLHNLGAAIAESSKLHDIVSFFILAGTVLEKLS